MTGVELIVAALAAGASAGVTDVASSAVQDAYTGLKRLLAGRLTGRDRARQALEAQETEPQVWQARIGGDLTDSGAAGDELVLAAARRLLQLAGPPGGPGGTYAVATNYGAVGTFNAAVTFDNHPVEFTNTPQLPPAQPGAV